MLTTEMKDKLIRKIQTTKNEDVLEEIYRILEVDEQEGDSVELTEWQKQKIQQGLNDITSGNYLPDADANKEVEKWLKK